MNCALSGGALLEVDTLSVLGVRDDALVLNVWPPIPCEACQRCTAFPVQRFVRTPKLRQQYLCLDCAA